MIVLGMFKSNVIQKKSFLKPNLNFWKTTLADTFLIFFFFFFCCNCVQFQKSMQLSFIIINSLLENNSKKKKNPKWSLCSIVKNLLKFKYKLLRLKNNKLGNQIFQSILF